MKLACCIAILVAACFSAAVHAWDAQGHMMVAAIAYDKLDAGVRSKVDALIKLNPMYSTWTNGVPAADKGRVAFMHGATWPDLIRGDSNYQDDTDDPSTAPDPTENVGYAPKGKYKHKYWHFVDVPFSDDGSNTQEPKKPNAQTQIDVFRQVLASTTADSNLKSYDLVWLEHLVGDVHQPLHATSRFTSDLPDGDRGGNLVVVPEACYHELHCYWDNVWGDSKDAAVATQAVKDLPDADSTKAADLTTQHWIDESFQLAKENAYRSPIGAGGKGPYTLTPEYEANAKKVAGEQIALAGARLANVLNDAFQQGAAGGAQFNAASTTTGAATPLIAAMTIHAGDVPDLNKTPGVARPGLTKQTICSVKWGKDARHVTQAMKDEVFASYGFTGNDDPKCVPSGNQRCEIDHLISREVGGADDAKNLWPQAYGTSPWNAHLKDKLENRLHKEMCAGNITLKQAQEMLVNDWRVAYKKYYGDP